MNCRRKEVAMATIQSIVILNFLALFNPRSGICQTHEYLSLRDSATFHFDAGDFPRAGRFLKACILLDDYKRSDLYIFGCLLF